MRTVRFDGKDSYTDFGLIRTGADIGSPSPRVSTVEVEGMDGVLDFTEYFGETLYDNREISFDFQVVPPEKTRNLWHNPPSATKKGVTVTANQDGTMTISGESTGETTVSSVSVYGLEPGKTYTASVDKPVASGNQLYFAIRNYAGGASSHLASFGNEPNGLAKSFTVPASSDYISIMLYSAAAGAVNAGDYRVMMAEGDAPEYWCAPGTSLDRSFHEVFSDLKNAIHGKRCRIELSEDPGFYYLGRCEVDSWQTNEKVGEISVSCDCEPYKLRQSVTEVTVELDGTEKTVVFDNLRKRVVPTFDTGGASVQIKQGANTFTAQGTSWSDGDLYFSQGENGLKMTGTGTVTVRYQERGL